MCARKMLTNSMPLQLHTTLPPELTIYTKVESPRSRPVLNNNECAQENNSDKTVTLHVFQVANGIE